MRKLLLIIDVQKDFINENTKTLVPKIEELINSNKYEDVLFTRFINDEDSIWYNKLHYSGCMTKEQQSIVIDTKRHQVMDKRTYTAFNEELKEYINDHNIDEIYLCGFDTDACVQKTALDLFENNYDVYVLRRYCMSHKGVELHNSIINNLGRLIGQDKII